VDAGRAHYLQIKRSWLGATYREHYAISSPMKLTCCVVCLNVIIALLAGCGPVGISPTTAATGTNAHSIDDVALWVKSDYHTRSPETPPNITNQPAVVPAAQLHALFSSQGFPIDVRKTDYRYCNLSNPQWLVLRRQSSPKFPLLWSPAVDASGRRLVVTVDLKADLFSPTQMAEQAFTNELARMEAAIRTGTGQNGFSLRERLRD
jgi:hypothetical protein